MSYLVFDIETVPDTSVWTPPEDEKKDEIERIDGGRTKAPTKPEIAFIDKVGERVTKKIPVHLEDLKKAQKLAALTDTYKKTAERFQELIDAQTPEEDDKKTFPPLFAHRPVAIGYVVLQDNFAMQTFGSVGTSTFGDDEARMLKEFGSFAAAHTLVSFGGKSFDMPVILLRSFKHGIGHGWHGKGHRYKYDEDKHIDVKLLLQNYEYGHSKGFSLDTFSKLCGLVGKDGVDGSMVAQMYDEGKHTEIESYVTLDAIETTFVFLRSLLMRGRTPLQKYQDAAAELLAAWNTWNPEQVAKVDTQTLLLSE